MDYLKIQRKKRIRNTIITVIVLLISGYAIFSYAKRNTLFSNYGISENCGWLRTVSHETEFTIPKSVYFTKVKAFEVCLNYMKKINVLYDLSYLDISHCTELQEVNIQAPVKELYIYDCSSLDTIIIPDNDTYNQYGIEMNNIQIQLCENLETLDIETQSSFIYIDNCEQLSSVSIYGEMYHLSIKECDNLEKVYLSDDFKATKIDCSDDVTFIVNEGTEAEQFVKDFNLKYEIE